LKFLSAGFLLVSYEVVDKHIRRLDQDLKKFEQELADERQQQEQLAEQTKIAQGKTYKRKRDEKEAPSSNKMPRTSRPVQSTLCAPALFSYL